MRHNAFTLIELMVVVTVIGVLAGLAVTSFHGSYDKATLDEAAYELYTTVRYAQQYAVTHQRACRVVLIEDRSGNRPGYRIEVEATDPDADEAFTVLHTGAGKPTDLPNRVRFARVLIEGVEEGGDHVVTFRPTGSADAAVIQLTNDLRTWSILIEPNTGRAKLVGQAVNQTPNFREDLDA